jgi:hypothetical protein
MATFNTCIPGDGDFDFVVLGDNAVELLCLTLLSVAKRVDIAATVQNDAIETTQDLLHIAHERDYRRQHDGRPTSVGDPLEVALPCRVGLASYTRSLG